MGPLTLSRDAVNQALEQYRAYLETLTFIQVDPRIRQKVGMSDIIQNTLLEAYRDLDRIQAMDTDDRKRWLRKMLVHNLLDELRRWQGRPLEVSLEQLMGAAEESFCRLQDWLAAEDKWPGEGLVQKEEGLRLLDALSRLEERQREALILQKYHGWKLAQIAEHLGCTTGAVAGHQARGLKALRKYLNEVE
jgi:RNA polymerase sigma-70 factor (ECF subfamily)